MTLCATVIRSTALAMLTMSAPAIGASQPAAPSPLITVGDSTIFSDVLVLRETDLREAPTPSGRTLGKIPKAAAVEVYGENVDGYVLVRYSGQVGYVHYLKFDRKSIPWQLSKIFNTDRAESETLDLRRTFGRTTTARILRREIWLGMTSAMVLESAGRPSSIQIITERGLTRQEWTYDHQTLVIKRGKLADIVDNPGTAKSEQKAILPQN